MALLIRNGEIVTASTRTVADIRCDGETITAIGRDLEAPAGAETIDATGKLVFPGFVDPHTHIHLPFMGTFAKDTYTTASRAALVGGTTCFIDFCIPERDEDPRAALETWRAKSDGQSACDYSFHIAVTRFDDAVAEALREIVRDGITSFKVFLAYKGAFGIDDEALYRTLALARSLGVVTCAHCENEDAIALEQARLLAAGETGPGAHHTSRPPIVEAEGVHHLVTFAELTGAPVYIVHLSCAEALDVAVRAKHRGVAVTVETLIQYLLLDKSWAERPNFEGAKYVMSPPLRDAANQRVLWDAIRHGAIDVVATDHAPFDFADQKTMGRDDFTKIPNGIPSLENRVELLYTHGPAAGRIDLHRFVDVASTQPARRFGLFPRKGTIQIGSDADLVVWDPDRRRTITASDQEMNVDYNPFEGFEVAGGADVVTVRGEVAVRDGAFVGTVGRGRFVAREPSAVG